MAQTNGTGVNTGAAKVCIRCGEDCSGRPRTKDGQGRYTCRRCFDAGRDVVGEQDGGREPGVGGLGGVEIEVDAGVLAAMLEGAVAAQGAGAAESAPCPGCGRPLRAAAAICTACGYNRKTGEAERTRKAEEVVGGVGGMGGETGRDRMAALDARDAERLLRMEYAKPIAMMVVALPVVCAFLSKNQDHTAMTVEGYLASYGMSVGAAVGLFAVFCAARLGFGGPMKLNLLRLAGIVAVVDVIRIPLVLFGSPGGMGDAAILWIVPFFLYIGLLYHLLDLDIIDAAIVGFFMGLLLIAAGVASNQLMGA